jgi:hypothetical protein
MAQSPFFDGVSGSVKRLPFPIVFLFSMFTTDPLKSQWTSVQSSQTTRPSRQIADGSGPPSGRF